MNRVRVIDRGPGVAKRWSTSDAFTGDASARVMTPV